MASVDKVVSAVYKLSAPLREKALKALGLSTKGAPGRKGDGIIVGRDRVRVQKKVDQLAGGAKGITVAAILHELLGIKSTSKAADRIPTVADFEASNTKPKRPDGEGRAVTRKNEKVTTPTPPPEGSKTKRNATTTRPTPKPTRNNTKKDKSDVTFQFETINKNKGGSVTKSNKGPQDFRKGGMVLSSVDNRKNRK